MLKGGYNMNSVIVDSAKVMAKGQITLPKDIRDALKITSGDRVTLVYKNGQVILMNSAVYAMKILNAGMKGEAKKLGLETDDDINALVIAMRADDEGV